VHAQRQREREETNCRWLRTQIQMHNERLQRIRDRLNTLRNENEAIVSYIESVDVERERECVCVSCVCV